MAAVYENQGDYTKSLEWHGRALAGREKSLGKEHPSAVSTASRWSIVKVKAKTGKPLFPLPSTAAGVPKRALTSYIDHIVVKT